MRDLGGSKREGWAPREGWEAGAVPTREEDSFGVPFFAHQPLLLASQSLGSRHRVLVGEVRCWFLLLLLLVGLRRCCLLLVPLLLLLVLVLLKGRATGTSL